jgi:hypothetical protein
MRACAGYSIPTADGLSATAKLESPSPVRRVRLPLASHVRSVLTRQRKAPKPDEPATSANETD